MHSLAASLEKSDFYVAMLGILFKLSNLPKATLVHGDVG